MSSAKKSTGRPRPSTKILILSHGNSMSGAIDRLEDFLIRHGYEVIKLQHPLDDYVHLKSKLTASKVEVKTYNRLNIPIVNYFVDFVMNLNEIARSKPEIVIGANNLDTFIALIGRVTSPWRRYQMMYFASDYSEGRFNNRILDGVYQMIEKYDNRHADIVISNTKRAESKRKKLGLKDERSVVIPNGVYMEKPEFLPKTIDKRAFLYVGSINPEHGLMKFVECFAEGMDSLDVVGAGEGMDELTKICSSSGIELRAHGHQPQAYVHDFMKQFKGLGLAPYDPNGGYVYFGSSMKMSEYLAHGVPVVTSDVTEQAAQIEEDHLGIVYKLLNYDEIIGKIRSFDTNKFYIKSERFYADNNIDVLYSRIKFDEAGLT